MVLAPPALPFIPGLTSDCLNWPGPRPTGLRWAWFRFPGRRWKTRREIRRSCPEPASQPRFSDPGPHPFFNELPFKR